jgi:hypothetical protein
LLWIKPFYVHYCTWGNDEFVGKTISSNTIYSFYFSFQHITSAKKFRGQEGPKPLLENKLNQTQGNKLKAKVSKKQKKGTKRINKITQMSLALNRCGENSASLHDG